MVRQEPWSYKSWNNSTQSPKKKEQSGYFILSLKVLCDSLGLERYFVLVLVTAAVTDSGWNPSQSHACLMREQIARRYIQNWRCQSAEAVREAEGCNWNKMSLLKEFFF